MEDNMIDVTPTDKKIEKIKSQSEDIKKDYEYTRGNLYSIIEISRTGISNVSQVQLIFISLGN